MSIRITRNAEGNCINFVGSTNPAYWNACLSAVINEEDANRIDIINDIRSQNEADIQYEFYAVSYTDFADKDGNEFTSAQEAVDYINAEANVIGVSDIGSDLTGISVNFKLDETSTSILLDNGHSFGVNTIKAVPDVDGTIHIHAVGDGLPSGEEDAQARKHFEKLEHTNVSINGTPVVGGLNDVVNALNELFTVGAFEAVVISDPYSTMVADVGGVVAGFTLEGTTAIDPVGSDIFTNSSSGNYAGLKSTQTINQAGEYFTFDIRGEGQLGFGLVHTQASFDNGKYIGSSAYANPTTFATSNSAHYGFQFSHWFHPTPNGSWTNYGASTGFITGPGWSNWHKKQDWLDGNPVKMKVGIDENGFIAIYSQSDNVGEWIMHARSSYPVPEGAEFHLGIKIANNSSRVATEPYVHLLEDPAPTMYFRYIESPDGVFHYPLFTTTEEAEYYDQNHDGTTGTGTYHTEIFPDDPTQTVWYMPDTGNTENGSSAPTGNFMGAPINWTEITSLTDADLVPSAFSAQTVTVNELSALNVQVHPQGATWTTTVGTIPEFQLDSTGTVLQGTAPEVTDNNVNNPSDTYTATIYRTNTYGTSQGTLTIVVNNLTAPATAISGFNWENTSTTLVDSDTLDDGSVVHMNTALTDGKRLIFDQVWIETNVLPNLTDVGDKFFIGIADNHDWTDGVQSSDFSAHLSIERLANNQMQSTISNGTTTDSQVISSLTDAYYDYAFEYDGTDLHVIACNVNAINTEPSVNDGGAFSRVQTLGGQSGNLTIHIGVEGATADLSATTTVDIPTPPAPTSLTPWNKALDFSGSSERAEMVSSNVANQPIASNSTSTNIYGVDGKTSSSSSARAWATACVFQIDGNSSNQHIWNQGEGAGSTDDNIYLRLDSSRRLYFGWGRSGEINECYLTQIASAPVWYGVYVAYDGRRWGSGDSTASNLSNTFDIRLMSSYDNFASSLDVGTLSNWSHSASTTGGRMDRTVTGVFSVGGRGANRNFHGKVASMVSTTLKLNVNMPTVAEAEMMITDPQQWVQDYKVGQTYRRPNTNTNSTNFQIGSTSSIHYPAMSTQVWLMGDGPNDSYTNMIRNQINMADQNYTKLNMISMVSSDIQNVTIGGLS